MIDVTIRFIVQHIGSIVTSIISISSLMLSLYAYRSSAKPIISASIAVHSNGAIILEIANVGNGYAGEVNINIDEEKLKQFTSHNIEKVKIKAYLASKQVTHIFLGTSTNIKDFNNKIELTIDYMNIFTRKTKKFNIGVTGQQTLNSYAIGDMIYEVREELREANKYIKFLHDITFNNMSRKKATINIKNKRGNFNINSYVITGPISARTIKYTEMHSKYCQITGGLIDTQSIIIDGKIPVDATSIKSKITVREFIGILSDKNGEPVYMEEIYNVHGIIRDMGNDYYSIQIFKCKKHAEYNKEKAIKMIDKEQRESFRNIDTSTQDDIDFDID